MKEEEKNIFNFQFPVVRNISPRTLGMDLESIPTEDMPRRMAEMFSSVSENMRKTINKELEKIKDDETKKDRIEYLESLLKSPLANMDKNNLKK